MFTKIPNGKGVILRGNCVVDARISEADLNRILVLFYRNNFDAKNYSVQL